MVTVTNIVKNKRGSLSEHAKEVSILNWIVCHPKDDGSVTLHAIHPISGEWVEIDPEQLWFWTPQWQAGERRVEEDLRLGRYEDFDDMDDFLSTL